MKRREEERLKRTVVFQTVEPNYQNELKKSPVSTLTITEVDVSTTDNSKALKSTEDGPLGFGSTTKPLPLLPMFDYARAVGSQSSRCFRKTETGSNAWSSCNSRIAVKAADDDMKFQGQTVRECVKDEGKVGLIKLTIYIPQ